MLNIFLNIALIAVVCVGVQAIHVLIAPLLDDEDGEAIFARQVNFWERK